MRWLLISRPLYSHRPSISLRLAARTHWTLETARLHPLGQCWGSGFFFLTHLSCAKSHHPSKDACNWRGTAFTRPSHLQRHIEAIHLKTKVFYCPVSGCVRGWGALRPLLRKDKRKDHCLNMHKDIEVDLYAFDGYIVSLMDNPADDHPVSLVSPPFSQNITV